MRILVVDDNHCLANILADYLSERGHSVMPTYEGRLGSIFCERENFDLIVIDLVLPDLNGIDVLERLRKKNRLPRAIVMTGFPELLREESARLEALDVDAVIKKPFSFSDINDMLTRLQ
jgi:two-component system, response regulator PdtaR